MIGVTIARILNRIITWTEHGLEYEPDQRHAEILIKEFGVTKAVATPGLKDECKKASDPTEYNEENGQCDNFKKSNDEAQLLNKTDAKRFRGCAARANYLAQDRPDIQFSVKEITRSMANPRDADWCLLKRLARYLLGAPRAVHKFHWQYVPKNVEGYVDSDWAGCLPTGRSTSGGVLRLGWHTIKTWSTTQATVALSSAEAELYSMVKGAAQVLGMISLAADFGINFGGKVHSDASAAIGIASRQGVGKIRHLNVRFLWIQDKVRNGELRLEKVPGTDNPADLLTKYLDACKIACCLETLCVETSNDRAEIALTNLDRDDSGSDRWIESDGCVMRVHDKPRLTMFTPLRVAGAPPARALTAMRVTSGKYCDNGECFEFKDNWTARASAHAPLLRRWTGTTCFVRKCMPVPQF